MMKHTYWKPELYFLNISEADVISCSGGPLENAEEGGLDDKVVW